MPAPLLGLAKSIYYINDGYHGHIYIYLYELIASTDVHVLFRPTSSSNRLNIF